MGGCSGLRAWRTSRQALWTAAFCSSVHGPWPIKVIPWITIPNPTSGSGNATVRLDIQANTGPARNGTATVAGKTVTVNQDKCTISISPTSQSFGKDGGDGKITVTSAGCTWTATSGANWIIIMGSGSGSGNGTIMFKINKNMSDNDRTDTITIGGEIFTVKQAGS